MPVMLVLLGLWAIVWIFVALALLIVLSKAAVVVDSCAENGGVTVRHWVEVEVCKK